MNIQTISAADFSQRQRDGDVQLCVDVRTKGEYLGGFCVSSKNLPLDEITAEQLSGLVKSVSLDSNQPVYIMCQAGRRAQMAADKLLGGLPNPLVVIEGGMNAMPSDLIQSEKKAVLPLERQTQIAIGCLVLLGTIIGTFVNPVGYGLSAFVGCGLIFAGVSGTCMLGMLVAKMPWNRA